MRRLTSLWRNARWWLFSKNEMVWEIRELQGLCRALLDENAVLRERCARLEGRTNYIPKRPDLDLPPNVTGRHLPGASPDSPYKAL